MRSYFKIRQGYIILCGMRRRSIMQNLKKLYSNNAIFQFIVSYILILIIPLSILYGGFRQAFHIVGEDINKSNRMMLSHSASLLDNELDAVQTLGRQTAQNAKLKALGSTTVKDSSYYLLAREVIDTFNTMLRYQGNNLIKSSYIYLFKTDLVIYESSLYRAEIYKRYVDNTAMTLEEWRKLCENGGSLAMSYVNTGENVVLVIPFCSTLQGDNEGAIVLTLNKQELAYLLGFDNDYSSYSVFMLGLDGDILWMNDIYHMSLKLRIIH